MTIEFRSDALETKLAEYKAKHLTDQDMITDLFRQGYTIDSFRYNSERYRWAKRVATTYGLI